MPSASGRAWGAARVAALLLLAAAAPAKPEAVPDHPPLFPARDAIIGYHLAPATGEAIDVRVEIRAGGGALRLDLPDASYMLAALFSQTLVMVVPLQQTALELPWSEGPQPLFSVNEHAQFTHAGEATVAKHKCTLWNAVLDKARSTVCVSSDGLVLSRDSLDPAGRHSRIEAFGIRYQALKDEDFSVPPQFERVPLPPGPRQ